MPASSSDARWIGHEDRGFPSPLREIEPEVPGLWVVGEDPADLGRMVGIVGARRPTSYGVEIARGLAADIALNGWCIVSGMALGIDAAAHEGALSVGGKTIAVLGCGVDVVYPASNKRLYDEIAERGAIVSHFSIGAPPLRPHFPERNRIIVGMCRAVVVVQAKVPRSGAMITGRLAADLNRERFAVPGDLRSALSSGPHQLLREGAHICTSAGDVLAVIDSGYQRARATGEVTLPEGLSPVQRAVAEAIGLDPSGAERISARTELSLVEVVRALARLELLGIVDRQSDGSFVLRAGA